MTSAMSTIGAMGAITWERHRSSLRRRAQRSVEREPQVLSARAGAGAALARGAVATRAMRVVRAPTASTTAVPVAGRHGRGAIESRMRILTVLAPDTAAAPRRRKERGRPVERGSVARATRPPGSLNRRLRIRAGRRGPYDHYRLRWERSHIPSAAGRLSSVRE